MWDSSMVSWQLEYRPTNQRTIETTVKNHGIAEDMIQGVHDGAKDFFSLPLSHKMKVIAQLNREFPVLILVLQDRKQKYANLQGLFTAS
jgi:isopenicillin N synthase-like dioxygenase